MKTFDDCKREIELRDPVWHKHGLPRDLYFLALLKLGIEHYICTVRDSGDVAEAGVASLRELEMLARQR